MLPSAAPPVEGLAGEVQVTANGVPAAGARVVAHDANQTWMEQVTTASVWIHATLLASWLGPLYGSLGFALTHVALWTGVAILLDRRRIYLKV